MEAYRNSFIQTILKKDENLHPEREAIRKSSQLLTMDNFK